MKDILDEESRQALIKYRMERAYDSMKEAQLMAEKSFYNAAINRLYYACFLQDSSRLVALRKSGRPGHMMASDNCRRCCSWHNWPNFRC